jgi:hypothetical protein
MHSQSVETSAPNQSVFRSAMVGKCLGEAKKWSGERYK